MSKNDKIIYAISVEDVQTVAEQELERKLTDDELKVVEDKIGDYFEWYESINSTLIDLIKQVDS